MDTHSGGSGTVSGAGGLSTVATSLTYSGDQVNPGTYYVTAHYAGDANHFASDGAPVAITITITPPSILILNATASGALSLSGNASLQTTGYVVVDSSSSSALTVSGNASITAAGIEIRGDDKTSGHASISSPVVTGIAFVADPFANLVAPSTTGLTNYGAVILSGSSVRTINPGIYTQISVSGNASLMLNPGTYIIAGGGFTVSGNASVTGSGILIYNAGSNILGSGNTFGAIAISGNAVVDLTASTAVAYAGIAIFQARDNTRTVTVSGNADVNLGTSVLYVAAATVAVSGNGELDATLIVNALTISGNGTVV